eukprot:Skav233802  [mRNA]  locus=scaffold780:551763:559938:- [translate_table: standard]
MGRLLMLQLHRVWIWSRDTMRRIIADIDTDGNGEIDWEEHLGVANVAGAKLQMKEALSRFKDTVKGEIRKALKVLRNDDDVEEMDTSDVVHWLLLIDMTIFSTQLSAFLLVVGHVLGEVKQFLTALTFLLLLFGSILGEADVLGFARLNRASLVVDAMASCPKSKWKSFISDLRLDEKREFDEGDLGLAGRDRGLRLATAVEKRGASRALSPRVCTDKTRSPSNATVAPLPRRHRGRKRRRKAETPPRTDPAVLAHVAESLAVDVHRDVEKIAPYHDQPAVGDILSDY